MSVITTIRSKIRTLIEDFTATQIDPFTYITDNVFLLFESISSYSNRVDYK